MIADRPPVGGEHDYSKRPILYDGCPRCEEQADDPLTLLDMFKQRALWNRMLDVNRRPIKGPITEDQVYKTGAEARAGALFYKVAIMLERHQVLQWGFPLMPMRPRDIDPKPLGDILKEFVRDND